ncbi:helix-turn-helix domain-containing protein [Flagellimonas onchidii]|uniref:helix-turn-helix domain-containing protein n=1 Tax=Flagellimonas onchidii TaxID=2562684 RepID=UPI0010A606C8|nr:helix-turn-helix domain-containing protein [Allomuricauda onchidii]
MKNLDLAQRVKDLRRRKGVSQEVLAEESGLSLRTIQRIENNETVPRGDTLKRLAIALNTTPDKVIDWQVQEDKGYLTLMNFSALGFLFFPLLGIILPLIFWLLKKDKLKNVNDVGKSILNFEITWSILFYLYIVFWFSGLVGRIMKNVEPQGIFLKFLVPIMILYLYNIVMILFNTIRVYRNEKTKYVLSLRLFK